MHALKQARLGGPRRWRAAAIIAGLAILGLVMTAAAYTDEFDWLWDGMDSYSSDELTYTASDVDLGTASGRLSGVGWFPESGTGMIMITRNGAGNFLFQSLDIDTSYGVSVSAGAWSTTVGGPPAKTVGPGAPGVLTNLVVIADTSGNDYSLFIDNVTVDWPDETPPTLQSFVRQTPSDEDTNADTLVFRVAFNEIVQYVSDDDFTVSGTTATVTGVNPVNDTTYDLTVSGGDLAGYDGTVGINLAAGQDIADLAGNALPAGEPATDEAYELDNTDPIDPTLESPTHTANVWSADDAVEISFSAPASDAGSGVDGFEVAWDTSPGWGPSGTKQCEESWDGATYTATSDGDWYFHLATVDNAGNWTSAQHLGPFKIDTTAPTNPALDCTSHTAGSWSNVGYIHIGNFASSSDAGSGVDGYEFDWSNSDTWAPTGTKELEETALSMGFDPPWDGDWYFHIATVDNVGNWATHDTYGPFRIDTVAPTNPVLTCSTHTVDVWSSDVPLLVGDFDTASDAASGVDGFYLSWVAEGGAVQFESAGNPGGDAVAILTEDGIWYLDCETRDVAGNASVPLHFGPFKIDTTGPVIGDQRDLAVSVAYGQTAATLTWPDPAVADVHAGLDSLMSTHHPGDSFPLGTTTVTYTAVDVVGNVSTMSFDVVVEEPMPLAVTPAGTAGEGSFLDRSLDLEEGEDPPMVGLCPLGAIYEIGESVTGACQILNPGGKPVRGTYIHIYIYSVDIEPRPEEQTLLDHWVVRFDPGSGNYAFSWDTTGMTPGTYDILLGFADGSSQICRIQLVEPVE